MPINTVLALKKNSDDQAIGLRRGGLSTKIHATCDTLGNPTGFHLTAGKAHDLEGADVLLGDLDAEALLADRAYDADDCEALRSNRLRPALGVPVRQRLEANGQTAVIPSKSNRKEPYSYDKELYKARHLIENFFANALA